MFCGWVPSVDPRTRFDVGEPAGGGVRMPVGFAASSSAFAEPRQLPPAGKDQQQQRGPGEQPGTNR